MTLDYYEDYDIIGDYEILSADEFLDKYGYVDEFDPEIELEMLEDILDGDTD